MTGPTSRLAFAELIEAFFRADGIRDPRREAGAARCRYDGFDVALHHDGALDPDTVYAYIDLGAVPSPRRREAFRSLLLNQLEGCPPCRTVVGLETARGHVVLVMHIGFDAALDGEVLAETLRRSIRQLITWGSPAPKGRRALRRRA